ncbi:MAG TPA: methionyl-tRNA formyltransferase [Bacteroidia bacterium]|jgi:methionyl-tRNA formyltransferase|nr:methionyl-tRNA formyltransferase [Bacteroidia bacterium]
MNIGYLASGQLGLSTLKACADFLQPIFIATDSNSLSIINHCKEKNIPLFKGNPRNGKLKEFMKNSKTDVLLSVNYLFLIDQEVIDLVKYPINFHGSLLPAYRGRTPHVWAIINGEKKTGVTAHIINSKCDEGDIMLQKEIPIEFEDTGADILKRYESIYPEMIKEILFMIKENKLQLIPQDHAMAFSVGKRTPDDGEINWTWQKEKIRNWVRAQAYPYPGAFTSLEGQKIIIDKISYSDNKYNQNDPDGLIVKGYPENIVKTSNGSVKLEVVRANEKLLKKNKVLGK